MTFFQCLRMSYSMSLLLILASFSSLVSFTRTNKTQTSLGVFTGSALSHSLFPPLSVAVRSSPPPGFSPAHHTVLFTLCSWSALSLRLQYFSFLLCLHYVLLVSDSEFPDTSSTSPVPCSVSAGCCASSRPAVPPRHCNCPSLANRHTSIWWVGMTLFFIVSQVPSQVTERRSIHHLG